MTKEELIIYLKSTEFDHARANAALIACDFVYNRYVESDKVHGSPFSPVFCYISYDKLKAFYQIIAKKIISDTAKRVYLDYLKDPKSLDKKIAENLKLTEDIDRIWIKYQKIRTNPEKREFTSFFKKFVKISGEWWYYCSIGEDKGAVINEIIVPKFAKRHDLELSEANEIFNTLSHPTEKTVFNIERDRFLEICLDVAQGQIPDRKIKKYLKDYFWIKTDFYKAEELTVESILFDARKEIAEKKIEGIKKEIQRIKENHKRLLSKRNEYLKTVILSSEDKKDLKFAEKTIQWIDIRKISMMKDFYYLFVMVSDVAKRAGLKYHDLAIYTTDEFERFIETGERIPDMEVRGRADGVMLKFEKGMPVEKFYGNDAKEMFEAFESGFTIGKEIKGQVASTGGLKTLTGVVRIIHQPTKETFNEGEILVTSMTRVEFVPLMRKAKAIITDEGGIACHAAIVSRELGLPCIIGTKNATRVLKDGDLVELNTERGIVKILNKL